MNQLPLISVLLPVYNAEKYIKKAVDSITNQTYQNLEIICINDGSKDNSLAILTELAKEDLRIKVISNEHNLGLIKTLNKAIEKASGEYLARMDADDFSLPERLEKQVKFLIRHQLDFVDCKIVYKGENGNTIKRETTIPKTEKGLQFFSFFKTPFLHPTILCKTEVLKNNLYIFNEKNLHCEDYELWTRLLSKEVKAKKMSEKLYVQLVNEASVSNKYEHIQIENFINLSYKYTSEQLNLKMDKNIWKICVNRFNSISRKEYVDALNLLEQIKLKFTSQETDVEKEIETILNQQILDIQIQNIKKTRSPYFVYKLLFSLPLYKEFNYFLSKF